MRQQPKMMLVVYIVISLVCVDLSCGFPVTGNQLNYPLGEGYQYTYTTVVTFNEPGVKDSRPAQKDVGFRLTCDIVLTPVWQAGDSALIELKISGTKFHSVSRELHRTAEGLTKHPVYFQWQGSQIVRVFASENDATLGINFKKGIISLFQVQTQDGTRTEMDASGECPVKYKVDGNIVTKVKDRCKNLEVTGQFFNVNPILELDMNSQSETVYTLKDDRIVKASSVESHLATARLLGDVTMRAFSSQDLSFVKQVKGSSPVQGGDVTAVVQALKGKHSSLYGMSVESTFDIQQCVQGCEQIKDLVAKKRDVLTSANMANISAAYTFLDLVDAFRGANKDAILAVLKHEKNKDILPQLIDVTAAAQTTASQEALMTVLDFTKEENVELEERYLFAIALCTHPNQQVLNDLLAIYKKNVTNVNLRESVGEALGSVAYTYCGVPGQCQQQIIVDVMDAILTTLTTCGDDNCRPMKIRALANAGRPQAVPTLLKLAEHGNDTQVCESAIRALRRIDTQFINTTEVKDVMKRIFYQKWLPYDTVVRSKAFKILMDNSPTYEDVKDILTLTDRNQSEFLLYIQSQIFNRMLEDANLKVMVEKILEDPDLANYDYLAPRGKSLSFKGYMAHTGTLDATYFMYVECSKAGLLKRSGMDVDLFSSHQVLPLYSFGIFSAGLEALMGDEPEQGQEEVEATAGISLDLIGVALRPITFFRGSGGLMSAVWNAPTDPVSAIQANLLLQDHSERIHLQSGLIVEVDVQGALSIDLSGSISISLWNKNARSLITNSGALGMKGEMKVATSTFSTGIAVTTDAKGVIDFESYTDFYDKPKTCLKMSRPAVNVSRSITKYERARKLKKWHIARIRRRRTINEVSYPLPPSNNNMCRDLETTQS